MLTPDKSGKFSDGKDIASGSVENPIMPDDGKYHLARETKIKPLALNTVKNPAEIVAQAQRIGDTEQAKALADAAEKIFEAIKQRRIDIKLGKHTSMFTRYDQLDAAAKIASGTSKKWSEAKYVKLGSTSPKEPS